MNIVYIYCEGQTEEAFVNEMLYPYFLSINIVARPIICTTKRTPMTKHRGGVSDYRKIKAELTLLCKQHKSQFITTMFDYYAMPANTPQIGNAEKDVYRRIAQIEDSITNDIGQPNCRFNLMLHEFEGLLFSEPTAFKLIADANTVSEIQRIRDGFGSPELINQAPDTAPSKRIEGLIPNYAKVKNGTIISKEIGIDRMLTECPHFAAWVNMIRAV